MENVKISKFKWDLLVIFRQCVDAFLFFILSFPAGIEEQLKYIKELGFDSIWLSPIYEDGGEDMGNDVKNHNNVDSDFGTNEDLQDLLKAIENEGFSNQFWN